VGEGDCVLSIEAKIRIFFKFYQKVFIEIKNISEMHAVLVLIQLQRIFEI
jgi:uncharacterized protein with NAD-binding domain and iron-sulfur cluster